MKSKPFQYLHTRQTLLSDYKKNRLQFRFARWDMVLKMGGPVLGILIGIGQYFYQQEIQQRKNFQREFWVRKFDMYGELSHAIGETLVVLEYSDSLALVKARAFRTIYWKTMLVEDTVIVPALVEFNETLEDYFEVRSEIDDVTRLAAAGERGPESSRHDEERLEDLRDAVRRDGMLLISLCKWSLENQKTKLDE